MLDKSIAPNAQGAVGHAVAAGRQLESRTLSLDTSTSHQITSRVGRLLFYTARALAAGLQSVCRISVSKLHLRTVALLPATNSERQVISASRTCFARSGHAYNSALRRPLSACHSCSSVASAVLAGLRLWSRLNTRRTIPSSVSFLPQQQLHDNAAALKPVQHYSHAHMSG